MLMYVSRQLSQDATPRRISIPTASNPDFSLSGHTDSNYPNALYRPRASHQPSASSEGKGWHTGSSSEQTVLEGVIDQGTLDEGWLEQGHSGGGAEIACILKCHKNRFYKGLRILSHNARLRQGCYLSHTH